MLVALQSSTYLPLCFVHCSINPQEAKTVWTWRLDKAERGPLGAESGEAVIQTVNDCGALWGVGFGAVKGLKLGTAWSWFDSESEQLGSGC